MKVFKFTEDLERFLTLTTSDEWIAHVVRERAFQGHAVGPSWDPPFVWWAKQLHEVPRLALGDFPGFLPGALILSQRALAGFKAEWLRAGELLQMLSQGTPEFWLLNVTRVLPALDTERTKGSRFVGASHFSHVDRYVFNMEAIGDTTIFKVPEWTATVFVTEAFASLLEASSLTGYKLEMVWSGE